MSASIHPLPSGAAGRVLQAIIIVAFALALTLVPARPAAAVPILTADLSGPLEPADLVASLVGAGVTTSNATYVGAETAAGTFSSGDPAIGFNAGIILSSGAVGDVVGPNTSDGTTTNHGTAGDADLTALSGVTTLDAAVLEFDFVPDADQIFFSYVFSSDEYNEFVNSPFNDSFGFFVNGTNCATVEGGDPVTVNTINNGNPFGIDATHPELYRNNDLDDGGGAIDTEMDGLTVVLTCSASVNPGVTNHMKLAIADGSDTALDSNVFLAAGSFSTTPPSPCGPMDVAFVIDDTGSMGPAIDNVKSEAASLLAQIDAASGGSDQLALVTFKDSVAVLEDLALGNDAAISAGLAGLVASGGNFLPEASDEAANTVINGLAAADRAPGQQTGDFDGVFRAGAVKILILVTDALPGGFDDTFTAGVDDVNAHARALEAAGAGILISAIYVPTDGSDPTEAAIMMDYATTTGGAFIETNADGTGTANAIASIIENCGGGNDTVGVTKFYDANANGTQDVGEPDLDDWLISITDGVTMLRSTPVLETLEPDDYVVEELMPLEDNWVPTTATSVPLTVVEGESYAVVFGNVCLGAGGGHTIGFWGNKNGQALIGAADLAALTALNLRNANGANFDPGTAAQLKNWLRNATATNMAYMLSAQLAAMALNVHNGLVDGTDLVYAPGAPSANPAGFTSVNALMADANAALGADGSTPSGDPNRALQTTLKDALDDANNNLSFAQAEACAYTFEQVAGPQIESLGTGQ